MQLSSFDADKNSFTNIKTSITHEQAHRESSVIAKRVINSSIEQKGLSLAIDKRFLELEDLTAVRNQNTNNKSLKMIDVDAPLEYSAVNVLLREPGGDDPITSFNIIADEVSSKHVITEWIL